MENNYLDFLPKETLEQIMFQMDGETIINFCNDYKRAKSLCTELFWEKKYALDFPNEIIPSGFIGINTATLYTNLYYSSPLDKWNIDKAIIATNKHYFIYAKNGARYTVRSLIHDLSETRQRPGVKLYIYHTGYRIRGTADEIIKALRDANIDQNIINQVLATAITPQNKNQEPYRSLYENEIEKYNKYERQYRTEKWSVEKAEHARKSNKFISATTGILSSIKSAIRKWKHQPTYIYHIGIEYMELLTKFFLSLEKIGLVSMMP